MWEQEPPILTREQLRFLEREIGTYLTYLRSQVEASPARNSAIRVAQTIRGRCIALAEQQASAVLVVLSNEERKRVETALLTRKTVLSFCDPKGEEMAQLDLLMPCFLEKRPALKETGWHYGNGTQQEEG